MNKIQVKKECFSEPYCEISNICKQLHTKEQEYEKAKQIILQAVEDFSLEYGTPQYDRLLNGAKQLGIEVKE